MPLGWVLVLAVSLAVLAPTVPVQCRRIRESGVGPLKMLLCTMVRNETAGRLLEWVEFHRMQGFAHIRIHDNTRKVSMPHAHYCVLALLRAATRKPHGPCAPPTPEIQRRVSC